MCKSCVHTSLNLFVSKRVASVCTLKCCVLGLLLLLLLIWNNKSHALVIVRKQSLRNILKFPKISLFSPSNFSQTVGVVENKHNNFPSNKILMEVQQRCHNCLKNTNT